VRLENLHHHSQECEYNPKKPVICDLGCDILVAKDELKVNELLLSITAQSYTSQSIQF